MCILCANCAIAQFVLHIKAYFFRVEQFAFAYLQSNLRFKK